MTVQDVTVLIPAHGNSTYLLPAVTSILNDAQAILELLVVDDRLDASGRAALARVDDVRLRVIPCEGEGLVAALNTGLAEARGALIARMDADDLSLPGRLHVQRQFLHANPSAVAVGGQVRVIDAAGTEIGRRRYPVPSTAVASMLRHRNALAHPAVMLRRDVARAVGGYRADFKGAEDYDLWLRMAERGALANISDDVLLYRMHGGQVTAAATTTVAESTYLAQWCSRQRSAGRADQPLPWTPGQSAPPAEFAARLSRARVRAAATLFSRARTNLANGAKFGAAMNALAWVLLRPRYAIAQIGSLRTWLSIVSRSRRSSN